MACMQVLCVAWRGATTILSGGADNQLKLHELD